MFYFTAHPSVVFLVSLVCLWFAARLGAWLRNRWGFDEKRRADFNLILTATLTLLGLLIGFSFSMAASRYDQRKNLEEAEANAIGTEYLRADLLPAADGAKVRDLLRKYVALRIEYYQASDAEVAGINDRTAKLQAQLWAAAVAPTSQQTHPVIALVVAGMNDVINSQGYAQAAWWNRIPTSAGLLMAVIGLLCNMMIGYGSLSFTHRSPLLVVLPLFIALAFSLITDIDTPRHGLIHVVPKNIVNLGHSMKGP
jgi:hypothetical protein